MKKAVFALPLLFVCFQALAEDNIKFVNADSSVYGELCIAATDSAKNLTDAAKNLGIHSDEIDLIYCNGQAIRRFARQYRDQDSETTVTAYVVSVANESPETRLCMAALTSDEQYTNIKTTYFSKFDNVENNVICNNMPLRQFVRKYRNRLVSNSSVETASL